MQGAQLRSAPRDYPKDHPAIDLLRYKQFILRRQMNKPRRCWRRTWTAPKRCTERAPWFGRAERGAHHGRERHLDHSGKSGDASYRTACL
ncbi:MAG: DUF2461 family protein [Flavobacteriales bacterium]